MQKSHEHFIAFQIRYYVMIGLNQLSRLGLEMPIVRDKWVNKKKKSAKQQMDQILRQLNKEIKDDYVWN